MERHCAPRTETSVPGSHAKATRGRVRRVEKRGGWKAKRPGMKIATKVSWLAVAGAMAWLAAVPALGQTAAPKSGTAKKAAAKAATATDEQPDHWTLRSVIFKGTKLVKPEQLMAIAGLKLEALVGKDDLEKAKDRLYESGCFDAVAYAYETTPPRGVDVTFELGDVEDRGGWRIAGLKLDSREYAARAAKELPNFGKEIPLTEIYGRRMSELAQTMLKEKGITESVIVKFEAGLEGGQFAVLRSKTPQPNIAEVIIQGSRVVPAPEVQKAMSGVAVGTPWDELIFRTFLETTARAVYEANGRLGAKFTAITTGPSKTGRGIAVTVTVDEGPQYKLRRLDIVCQPLREEEVNSLGGDSFRNGVSADLSELGRGMAKVIDKVKEEGYLKATYHFTKQLDEEQKAVDIRVEVEPGPQYKMGRLEIDGLDMEAEPEIRKMWAMKPGDPYRAGYPDMFLDQVKKRRILDFLGGTRAETKVDDKRAEVDVKLFFKGGAQKLDSRPRDKKGVLIDPNAPGPPK